MTQRFADKVIAIAGGASGIGAASARRLATEGAQVVIGDINGEAAHATATEISAAGVATAFTVDIADQEQVAGFIDYAVTTFGRLDGYFNNAADISPGNIGPDTDAVDIPIEIWQHTLDVNLTGYLHGIRHAVPHLIAAGGGSIVNTTSDAAFLGEPVRVAYGTTKAGMLALSRNTASRYGKNNIRSNCVAPGMVLTEIAEASMPTDMLDEILARIPSTRHGRPEDIAAMVAFLLSDDSAWITGQVFRVNGGQTLS